MTFNRWDETPLYLQLARTLRARIERGDIAPGERLPTQVELAETYGIARETVRMALKLLRDEGVIRTYRGRGSFVPPREEL